MVKKNLTLSVLSAFSKALGGIGLIAALAHIFSLGDFGVFTYSFTLATILSLLIDYGFNTKLLKDIANDINNAGKILGKSLVIKSVLLILLSIPFFIYCYFSSVKLNETAILYLFLGLTCFSFTNTFLCYFKAANQYSKDVMIVIADNLLTLIMVIATTILTNSIVYCSLAFFISKLIVFFISLIIYNKCGSLTFPSVKEVLAESVEGIPFAIHYIVGNLYLNIDTLIIENHVPIEDLGIYQAGIRIVIGSGILLTVINSVYLPLLTVKAADSKNDFTQTNVILNTRLLIGGLFMLIILISCAPLIINVLYGSKFVQLNKIFWIFSIIIFLRITGSLYGIVLTISNKQYFRAIAAALSVLVILILDTLLVPKYGIISAAYVLLGAHIFINTLYMWSCYKNFGSLYFPNISQIFHIFREKK